MSSREIARTLAADERQAMEGAGGTYTGARVPALDIPGRSGLWARLDALGLIGANGGLTDVGANVALIVKAEQEERLFG